MRIVVFGAGAVGSVIGARLHQGGTDVALVARPAHVEAIRAQGLSVRTGQGVDTVRVTAVERLEELTPRADDVVLITAKTQDTQPIHDAVVRWNRRAAVVCGTNGIEHERMALRRFERVYGMLIQSPCQFERPGEVVTLTLPTNALIDLGRYPVGVDDTALEFAAIAAASPHLSCVADPDIMVKKAGKLLVNLGNVPDAAVGFGGRFAPVTKAAIAEAKAVFDAAGVAHELTPGAATDDYNERMQGIKFHVPEGYTFTGGSTWQSLMKGATSLETDYFNGEVVLLGRLHGIATPHNLFLQELADELLHTRAAGTSMTAEELDARWVAATGGAPE